MCFIALLYVLTFSEMECMLTKGDEHLGNRKQQPLARYVFPFLCTRRTIFTMSWQTDPWSTLERAFWCSSQIYVYCLTGLFDFKQNSYSKQLFIDLFLYDKRCRNLIGLSGMFQPRGQALINYLKGIPLWFNEVLRVFLPWVYFAES